MPQCRRYGAIHRFSGRVESLKVTPVHTTGAGDAVLAGLLSEIVQDMSILEIRHKVWYARYESTKAATTYWLRQASFEDLLEGRIPPLETAQERRGALVIMVGSVIIRATIMVLGYLYPAYEFFKCVEKKRPDQEHHSFWCQYWMIIAVVTVLERLGDALISCGEPKSWYSVPGTAADEFEKVMRSSFPDLFEAQPDLLFQLVTMLKATVLRDNGVPVCMTVQEPRNFVITFPRSYHGGFNHVQSLEDCKVRDVAAAPGSNKRRLRRGEGGASSLTSPLTKKVKGRPYKYSELADTWLNQARGAGKSHLRAPVLEELLTLAEQLLWGGHEMDQVREIVQKLKASHKWVQDVAACATAAQRHGHASSGKAVKVNFALVDNLVTVDPVPWVEPHLQTLKSLFEPAQRMELQITESLTSSQLEIRALQALQQEASHSPFDLPGLQQLKDVLDSAQVWSERARKLLSCTKVLRTRTRKGEVDLEQLQSLHAEGLNIPVIIGDKELLDSVLKIQFSSKDS